MGTDLSQTRNDQNCAKQCLRRGAVRQNRSPTPPIRHDVEAGVPAPDSDITPAQATPEGVNLVM